MAGFEFTNYKAIPLLDELSEEEFAAISPEVRIHAVEKGRQIFSTGQSADIMYLLYRGSMKITKELEDGREHLLYIYKTGEFIGALNLLSGDTYQYNGIALEKSFVVTISKEMMQEVLLNNTTITKKLLAMSYERIRFSEQRLNILYTSGATEKVAKALIFLTERIGEDTEDGILVSHHLTREELGSFAGLTRETMSRKITEFQEKGLISEPARGSILINDLSGLKELARLRD